MTTTSSPTGFAADPIIPARDLLLNGDDAAEIVGRMIHREEAIEACTLRRATYRIGECLRVVYDVDVDGRSFTVSARTFHDSAEAFRRSLPGAENVGGMPGVTHDQKTHSVWWTLPNDLRLRNVATLLDPPRRVRESSGVAWDHSVLVGYAPEQSATVRILDAHDQSTGFAKVYRDRDALDVATQHNRVAASIALLDGIRTPRALGWARPDRIVVLEAMRGRTWTQLPGDLRETAIRQFGEALANVHGLPTDFGRGPFQRYRMERVLNSANLVAIARTDVAAAVQRLRDKLAEGPPPKATMVCLHGDVRANNVMFHGDQVHLIGFDEGGSGAASADIGSMLASLMTAQLIDPDDTIRGLAPAFLEGYKKVRALPNAAELRWYTGAALLVERAIRAVNRVNLPALAVLPDLVHRAEAVLAGKVRIDA